MSDEYKDNGVTPESDDLKVMNDASVHPVGTSSGFKGSGQSLQNSGHASRYTAQGSARAAAAGANAMHASGANGSSRSSEAAGSGHSAGNMGSAGAASSGGSGGGKVPNGTGTGSSHPDNGGNGANGHNSGNGGNGHNGGNGVNSGSRRSSGRSPREKRKEAAKASTSLSLHEERELKKRRKIRRIIIFAVCEVIVLALIVGYTYVLRRWNQIQRPAFDEEVIKNNDLDISTLETMEGYWTIAVFGVDSRDKALTKSTNADVNLICNLNLATGEIKLVSVYRDTYLQISKDGTYNKINQAYFVGGPEQAVSALNRNLDLNITDYMTFNWKAVADAINVLGGVDIDISNAEYYYINSFITETVNVTGVYSTHLTHAGMNHLEGVQAVAYGRLRLMDTDYARTERQRKVIALCFEKAKEADFDTLNRVLATVFPQVATSIDLNDIFNGLKVINRFHLGETTGFPQQRGDANMGKKGACVIPQTLTSNVKNLHQFLFDEEDYTPSSTVQNISAKISEDTQMYKEAAYIESVGTDNGVIQSDKESKAAEAADNDKKYVTIYVKDSDGNKVKKTVVAETDEDGEIIQPETDADGYAVDYRLDEDGNLLKRASKPTAASTEAETDEDGNPIETTSSSKPTAEPETDEDGNPIETTASNKPTAARDDDEDEDEDEDEATTTRPTSATGTGGVSANPGSSGSSSSAPTSATTDSAPTAADNVPQVVDAPGSNATPTTEAAGPSPTAPTAAATTAAQDAVSSNGPGGTDTTPITPTAGTVAAPGM